MKIKQVALCISVLTVVGCGGTPSSNQSQSTESEGVQSRDALQALKDRRKLLEEKIDARQAEIQKLEKNLKSEQNIDEKVRLAEGLLSLTNQSQQDYEAIEELNNQIEAILDAESTPLPGSKPGSPRSKEPQTREEYIDAIVRLYEVKYSTLAKNLPENEVAKLKQEAIAELNSMSLSELKEVYAEGEMGGSASLSNGITNLSHRKARLGQGEAKLAHFNLNGQSLDNAIDLSLPMFVQLKGNLDTTGKDSDVVGSVAYNLNGWVAGVVHGYAHTVSEFKTHESAIMMSKSFNGLFVEGQLSGISGMNQYGYGLTGSRYLVTLGYDHSAVSPFVQYQYLGFGEFDKQGVYLGLDTDVLSIQTSDAKLTSKVLAKIGYEFGFKSNISAYVEWTSSLKLSDGLEISNVLNIGPKDQTVKLNVSFEQ